MYAIRAKAYKVQEFINEGYAEDEIWVNEYDDVWYHTEKERGVWNTQKEAYMNIAEPWEEVVEIE